VFQVLLALQNMPQSSLEMAGLTLSLQEADAGQAQFDLSVFLSPLADGGLHAWVSYVADLFDAATIERLLGHFHQLLEGVVVEGGERARISELPLLTGAERAQLAAWDQAEHRGHPEGLLHGLFEAQAQRTPEARALVAGSTVLTYAELEERSAGLAARLRALGAGPETAVAVCLERTADLVVTLLAVLRAGAFYVPLDPRYPVERLRFLLEDSGARILVASSGLAAELPAPETRCLRLDLDDAEAIGPAVSGAEVSGAVTARNLAYLIYTSGSTGRPKAVAIEHRSAVAFAWWARESFSAAELRGVLASTAVTFDLSVFEIFVPLAWGGTVVLAENALALPEVAAGLPPGVEITLINTVPSALAELLREDSLPQSVRTINLAGEALPRWLADRAYARPETERLCNLYGPSEDTTYSTWTAVERATERAPAIGRPVHDTRAYVLDPWLERLPVGIPGELCLAGAGLARGYLGRPELTAERFLPDPFGDQPAEPGARMYRTGDLVRLRPDGELEYLGRLDHQVKVRGYRIELGEVEAALAGQPGVESAVVLAREDVPGDRRLVAYVVASGAEPAVAELRRGLQQTLPEPFIPSGFVFLETFPLTPHGKVDRRALPAPDGSRQKTATEFVAPRNSVEEALAAVWAEVLRRDGIGVHDNFFELGGDSIRTIQVVARSRKRGIRIAPRHLFEHQTLAELVAVAEIDRHLFDPAAEVPLPLTPAQRHRASLPGTGREVVRIALPAGIAAEAVERALRELPARHDALRLRLVHGPGGWSQWLAPAETGVVLERAGSEADALQLLAGGSEALRAALPPDGNLILAAHPLALDGPSWGVLLAELPALCQGDAPPAASPVTFVRWAEALAPWAAPWAEDPAAAAEGVPSAGPATVLLGEAETSVLLGEARDAYGNTVEEILLAAVAGARPAAWTLAEVDGLRPEIDGLESGRVVVGCLAAPVRVQIEKRTVPGDALKEVKERLRRTLRLGAPIAEEPGDLGQPDVTLRWTPPLGSWHAERVSAPPAAGAGPLRVDCRLEGGRLRADWTSAGIYQKEDLERIADRFREQLSALIRHCQSSGAGGFTPSDFPVSRLDQAELDELLAKLGQSME
jgi:amino acid adenylation domain-containing protein